MAGRVANQTSTSTQTTIDIELSEPVPGMDLKQGGAKEQVFGVLWASVGWMRLVGRPGKLSGPMPCNVAMLQLRCPLLHATFQRAWHSPEIVGWVALSVPQA